MNKLLYRLTTNLPMRLIDLDLKPYLERYHLAALGGCRAWLHHFVSADADRNVHDHPWPAISIILSGGYRELVERADGSIDIVDHNAPSINWIPAHKRHRILQMEPGTWSLMLVGRRHGRGWTVYNNDGTSSHEPDEGRNLNWHKTAGNRAAAYETLEQRRRAAGLFAPKHFNCRCQAIPVHADDTDGHQVDAITYALASSRAKMFSRDVPPQVRQGNGRWVENKELIADINKNRRRIFGDDTPSIEWGGALTSEQIKKITQPDISVGYAAASAERHDNAYYPARMTCFEWLTRCQRELARQTNNWFGDWGPNALEAWEAYTWSTPEEAATKYLNDEFTNGR